MRQEQALSRSPIFSRYALDQASRKTPEVHLGSPAVRKKQQQLIINRKLIIPIIAAIICSTLAYVFLSGIMMPSQTTNHAIVVNQSPLPRQNIINKNYNLLLAIDQPVTTNTNTPVSVTLAGTDPDKSDSLTAAIVTTPSHGSLSKINEVTGIVTYTPDRGFSGQDKFTFKVNNGRADSYNVGTVSITINQIHSVNRPS